MPNETPPEGPKRAEDALFKLYDACVELICTAIVRAGVPSKNQWEQFEHMADDAQAVLVEIGVMCADCEGGGQVLETGKPCPGCVGKGRLR